MMPGMHDREQEQPVTSPFPKSKSTSLDRSGIDTRSHIDKKGTPSGLDARLNHLPPGMNIQDQKVAHIEPQPFLRFRGYNDRGRHAEYRAPRPPAIGTGTRARTHSLHRGAGAMTDQEQAKTRERSEEAVLMRELMRKVAAGQFDRFKGYRDPPSAERGLEPSVV